MLKENIKDAEKIERPKLMKNKMVIKLFIENKDRRHISFYNGINFEVDEFEKTYNKLIECLKQGKETVEESMKKSLLFELE